jgi:hypothetical protein
MAQGALVVLFAFSNRAGAETSAPTGGAGTIRFYGNQTAELFSKELDESLQGVIENSVIAYDASPFPKGFVRSSLPGHWWDDTSWTRDAGGILRELALWGRLEQAVLVAEFLRTHVGHNPEGYHTFPVYFRPGAQAPGADWGTEMDGTSAIVIGMVRLWQRLPAGHEMKDKLRRFLTGADSPIAYVVKKAGEHPLIAGSGEFGGGWGVEGEWYNIVTNNLVRQALLACAEVEEECGHPDKARVLHDTAARLGDNIQKHLVDAKDGSWVWCISPQTMTADAAVVNHPQVRGTASINGASSCYADAEGLEPIAAGWSGAAPARMTLDNIYNNYAVRKAQFEKYGMCTFVDFNERQPIPSYASWLSYCDCFAAQTMLLLDKTEALDKILTWIAATTYMEGSPTADFIRDLAQGKADVNPGERGRSRYWFTERNFSPDFTGERDIGCGKLNIVNVAEPMKLARLMAGIDDRYADTVRIVPRLPASWTGVECRNWPVKTKDGVVNLNLHFVKKPAGRFALRLEVEAGKSIPRLAVRFPDGTRKDYGPVAGTLEIK